MRPFALLLLTSYESNDESETLGTAACVYVSYGHTSAIRDDEGEETSPKGPISLFFFSPPSVRFHAEAYGSINCRRPQLLNTE